MSASTAYERMLKDGSAFKKFDMKKIEQQKHREESVAVAGNGTVPSAPLGDPVDASIPEETHNSDPNYDDTDWSDVDAGMSRRMLSLKSKINERKSAIVNGENKRLAVLEKKVKKLEKALMLIMESHEQLMSEKLME